jgi:hypothetical protein
VNREELERRLAEMKLRLRRPVEHRQILESQANDRSLVGSMENYLRGSRRRLNNERRVTAFYGVRTSWPRITEHAKYRMA